MPIAVGRICTDPTPIGRFSTTTRPWWMIIRIDDDFGRLYRSLLANYSMARYGKVTTPEWGTHISVIRGEEPPVKSLWKSWENAEIVFEYHPAVAVRDDSPYIWMPVKCVEAEAIRDRLGLSLIPEVPFHLTFARTTE